ncbi:MAG: hypothetical protein ACI8XZ_004997, partial [Gammaproteobacteria bacterium]
HSHPFGFLSSSEQGGVATRSAALNVSAVAP